MMKKCSVVEIDDSCIVKHEVSRKFLKLKCKSDNYNLEVFNNIYLDLKHRRAYIIVEGEEINIKQLTLPKVKREALYELIKNELSYYYKSLENIVFTHIISKEHKNNVDIIVFCMNERKINFVQNSLNNNIKIKSFYAVQLCFLNYFQQNITEKNYVFVFKHRNSLYFLYCIDNKLIHNTVYKINDDAIDFKVLFNNFIENSKILYGGEVNTIYIVNCGIMKSINDKSDKVIYVNLGELKEEQLVIRLAENRS